MSSSPISPNGLHQILATSEVFTPTGAARCVHYADDTLEPAALKRAEAVWAQIQGAP